MTPHGTISLGDAARISGPQAFNLMIKPAGSACNMACRYCYYLDKSEIYAGKEPVMSPEMLETVIREYIRANDVPEVQFNWHGGEPLVLGPAFFRKAVELERKYADGKTIFNTIQTNGTLITPEWAAFFAENRFLVGISIDGPRSVHDRYRLDKGGAPTFDRVMKGLECLKAAGAEFNTMSAVSKAGEGRGLEIYKFLKAAGSRYMQFMPVYEHVLDGRIVPPSTPGSTPGKWSVSAAGFGEFLCEIFDYWVRHDVGKVFVGQFDAALSSWCGAPPGICVFNRTCGGNSVIEHNGDVYSCDHFVYPRYRLGNIATDDLRAMMSSDAQIRFGMDKRDSLPQKCLDCRYLFACNGECPKHRFGLTPAGEPGLNTLCEAYLRFYSHTEQYFARMRDLLLSGSAPADIMAEI